MKSHEMSTTKRQPRNVKDVNNVEYFIKWVVSRFRYFYKLQIFYIFETTYIVNIVYNIYNK